MKQKPLILIVVLLLSVVLLVVNLASTGKTSGLFAWIPSFRGAAHEAAAVAPARSAPQGATAEPMGNDASASQPTRVFGAAGDSGAQPTPENGIATAPILAAGDTRTSRHMQSNNTLLDPRSLENHATSILLQAGGIDTRSGPVEVPEHLRFDPIGVPAREPVRYLVQFSGPILPSWKREVETRGGTFGDYLPHHAFIIELDRAGRDAVERLPFVQWIDYYHPAYKLSSNLHNKDVLARARRLASSQRQLSNPGDNSQHVVPAEDARPQMTTIAESPVLLLVQTFERNRLSHLYEAASALPGTQVAEASDQDKSRVLLEVPHEILEQALVVLAQDTEIEWIEPHVPPSLHNVALPPVVQSPSADSVPLWQRGLTGSGQIVGFGDTGLDADMVFFWDDSAGLPTATVNHQQRKVLSYHDLAATGDWDGHDHGTHVAGTIAGKSLGTGSNYNGIAFDARLVVQDIGDGGTLTGIPADLNSYFQQAYDDGARIHNSSWGSAVNGAYTSFSRDADQFMWEHPDFLIVFSAGNEGSASGTIGSPGTAKNIVTSGAGQNAHPGYDPEHVASFSSQGPTIDGRIKPTVVAPGHYLLSADNDGSIGSFNSAVRSMSGTSMSAPVHAGSAALIRQYFTDGYYPGGTASPANALNPSAALLKAVLINSSVSMSGSYTGGPIPASGQGWGRIVLDNTLRFQGDSHSLFVDDHRTGLFTGEEQQYTFSCTGQGPVKVTLVWTDHSPSLSAAVQLVNDLDLTVQSPSALYRGNVFSQGVSVSEGTYDRLNVEEQVLLPDPDSGAYIVTVSGHNVPSGPQPFALVVTGLTSVSQAGVIFFDKSVYRPQDSALITVKDSGLDTTDGVDSATIRLRSTDDPGYAVQAVETDAHSGTFETIVTVGDQLQLAAADTMTATYEDSDDGSGSPRTVTATAAVDGLPAGSFALKITDVSDHSARIIWQTDEEATGTIRFRTEGGADWQYLSTALALQHTATIDGLQAATRYEFMIESRDRAGNVSVLDNAGRYYPLRTSDRINVLYDSMETNQSAFSLSSGSNSIGENGLWHLSQRKAFTGTGAWYYGMEASGTYNTGQHNWGSITSTVPVDLTTADSASLSFRQILKTENDSAYDIARVQISVDNVTFVTVYQSTGSTIDWEQITIDLAPFIGSSIFVRFSFDTIDEYFNDYEGWLVDDIGVTASYQPIGDIDGDGESSLSDLVSSLQVVSGSNPNHKLFLQADTDGDGRIGLAEAILLLQELSR